MPNQEILKLERLHKEGSFNTQRSRKMMVRLIARQLDEAGFRNLKVKNLKPKHVEALVSRWQQEGISVGTFKNRMGALRWIFGKAERHFLMDRSNAAYGIGDRQYATNANKARELTPAFGDIERVKSPHVRMSLELQRAFGLRREEALKIQPGWADRGSKLLLLGSWTKGGRGREVPIRTAAQREVLERAKELAGTGSMIPRERKYSNHLRVYKRQVTAAGFDKLHGLRHAYAQERYEQLTGRAAPAAGGKRVAQMTAAERKADGYARGVISEELGHGRRAVAVVYVGR